MPRVSPAIALAAAMAAPLFCCWTSSSFAQAQPAPTPTNPDAPPPLTPPQPANSPLVQQADTFWHFAKVAKYDLAAAEGKKLIDSGASSTDLLAAFQTVANDHGDQLFETLFKWSTIDPLKDVSQGIIGKLKEGQTAMYTDPKWIGDQVARMSVNQRGAAIGLANLRQSGEFAAPIMVDVLRDPNKRNLHTATRQGLVSLGRQVLNPLVAVLESKDTATLTTIVGVLGDVGYPDAAPYIARVYANNQPGMAEVKSAAGRALAKLGYNDPASIKAADMFYDLGEKFYYGNVSIVLDPRFPDAHIWSWDDAKGLTYKDVPQPIFNQIMSQRACEYALKLDPNRGDVVSLWLAANNRREADIPEGKTDPTHEGPDAHFYNVALGTQYCNAALSRALKDRTPAVALKVVKSLQEIIGQSNMFQGAGGEGGKEPIIGALLFPNRPVRYEAAIAVGSAFPTQPFNGQETVVPTLAEAVSTSGKPNVVIVSPDQNAANAMKEALKDAANADTGTNVETANAAAGRMPNVDVAIIDARNNKDADAIGESPRLRGVPKVIIVEDKASPYVAAEVQSPLINTIVAGSNAPDGAALGAAMTKARERMGAAAMDDKTAESYALRSAQLLERLALSRGQVLDVTAAQPALMRALEDPRIEIAKTSAGVLGLINNKEAQTALAAKATDDKANDDLKIAVFKGLARSAKFNGNQLDANMVEAVQKVVETNQNLQVRSAAAEAQGALNLPADRAKTLIINQSQVGK
jgi:hypothetical protein